MQTTRGRPPLERSGPCLGAGLTGVALLGLCLWKGADAAGGDRLNAYGRHLAQECTGCHRIDGIDNGIPSIIGWKADRFVATLKFYQSGARTNPVMVSVASSLDDRQLEALATYFASLPKPPAKAAPSPAPRPGR
jgi:cytochrome c553